MTTDPNQPRRRLDADTVFSVLSRRPRARILASLATSTFRWQDELEARASDPTGREPAPSSVALHHNHLPRLDEADLIDWDRRTGLVTRGEQFEAIRPLLEHLEGQRGAVDAD